MRLYVDKRALITQWAAAGSEYSGTVAMKASVFYDLTLEYQTVGEVCPRPLTNLLAAVANSLLASVRVGLLLPPRIY